MKTCNKVKSLYLSTAFKKKFFRNNRWYMFISCLFSLVPHSVRRKMSGNAGNIRKPKRAGGRTKIKNNSEGLFEDLIIEKNLRTPENSSEDANTRDNRLQEIH